MVVGPDWMDHGSDSWAQPDSSAHPNVLAAIAAIRAGLRALLHERGADAVPCPLALHLAEAAPHDPDGIDETLDGLSLLTLGAWAQATHPTAMPVVLPPQAPASSLARARAGLDPTPFEAGVLAPDPPCPAMGGLRRGGSYATDDVRGPRLTERRPES